MSGSVSLQPLTRENWQECVQLSVAPEQKDFVAPNVYSLAQSRFEPLEPLAVYAGEEMVGFVMFGPDPDFPPERQAVLIYRLMIDAKHQGKGYGRAAIELVLERLRACPEYREVFLGVAPGNLGAESLYRSLGFVDSDIQWPGERVLKLQLK